MPKFELFFLFFITLVKSDSDIPSVSADEAGQIGGIGLSAFGLFQLLRGKKDRHQKLRSLSSEISYRSWADFVKDRKVHDVIESMGDLGDSLSKNFRLFKRGMTQNVKSLRHNIKELVQKDNKRLLRLENEMTSRHGDLDDNMFSRLKRSRRLREGLYPTHLHVKNSTNGFKMKQTIESKSKRKSNEGFI